MKQKNNMLVILLLCCGVLTDNSALAQQFGARVGTAFSYFTDDFKMKGGNPGLLVGGIVNYPLSDAILLTGGLDYIQMRGTLQNIPTFNSGAIWIRESNITIHAIEASGYGAYKLPLSFLGDAAPYVLGGFSIAYNAGTWDKFEITQIRNDLITTLKGNDNIKSQAVSWLPAWNVGLRFESPLDGGLFTRMVLDFRLRSSFDPALNVFPLNGSVVSPGVRSVSASLGFLF
jgi:hypothetical protein